MARLSHEYNIGSNAAPVPRPLSTHCRPEGSCSEIGPLLDCGAPYSAIGLDELCKLVPAAKLGARINLGPLPASVQDRPYWQYGKGSHASEARAILGSTILHAVASDQTKIAITHLVLEGPSQWVIGQNVTRHCNICSIGCPRLEIPTIAGGTARIPLLHDDLLQYLPVSSFLFSSIYSYAVTTRAQASIQDPTGIDTVTHEPAKSSQSTSPLNNGVQLLERINCNAPGQALDKASTSDKARKPEWSKVRPIIDRVHKHVCGHSSFGDIKTLLERNHMWTEDARKYLCDVTTRCGACRAAQRPPASRTVSLSSLSRAFNDAICIDHLFLGELRILHVMDAVTRYSAGLVVDSLDMNASIHAFEVIWLSCFWAPVSIYGDRAFASAQFNRYVTEIGSTFCPVPARRHSKNVIESKHGIIRSIFLRLKAASPTTNLALTAIRSIAISNNLCGSDILSAFEMARGFTRPVNPSSAEQLKTVPSDLLDAQQSLLAKRKLLRILRSKTLRDPSISPGDLVEVFIKTSTGKRGKWTTPRTVLAFDPSAWTVTVPGTRGKTITAAIEDVRPAIEHDSFASMIREADDSISAATDDMLKLPTIVESSEDSLDFIDHNAAWLPTNHRNNEPGMFQIGVQSTAKPNTTAASTGTGSDNSTGNGFSTCNGTVLTTGNGEHGSGLDSSSGNRRMKTTRKTPRNSGGGPSKSGSVLHVPDDDESDTAHVIPQPNDHIEVYWPLENTFFRGCVTNTDGDRATVQYDDGDIETLHMPRETWRFASSAVLSALSAVTPSVQSCEPNVLDEMLSHFGNKSFLLRDAQAFPGYPMEKAYTKEESSFTKTVNRVPLDKVPIDANIITSHTLYRVKQDDGGALSLKARIAPHGNEDLAKFEMRSDCSSCAPHGVRLLLSMAVIQQWRLTKIDVTSAFLQTGAAERDVYVVPPNESADHGRCLWLLLTAAYGLVNANAKFQVQADATLQALGLTQVKHVPQLFMLSDGHEMTMLVAKIVDDVLIAGTDDVVEEFVTHFNAKFKLGTISRAPGLLRFFGLNIAQHSDCSIVIDADDKLQAVETYPITRLRRRQGMERLNEIEMRAFRSVNCSVGWLGITVSPFCALFNSRLQQLTSKACVKDLADQSQALRELKDFGTTSTMAKPPSGSYELSVVCYSDAGRDCDAAQLSYIIGLAIGDIKKGSVMHTLSWQSRKSQRPVRSIGAAEILACSDAIVAGKTFSAALSDLLQLEIPLIVLIDSKDLFDSLSTQRNSVDRSIRGDVAVIRHDYEMGHVKTFTWIPGKENIADAGTKRDSPLRDALRLLLAAGKLPLDHNSACMRSADRPLG